MYANDLTLRRVGIGVVVLVVVATLLQWLGAAAYRRIADNVRLELAESCCGDLAARMPRAKIVEVRKNRHGTPVCIFRTARGGVIRMQRP